jgi:tRNA-2-methylthio-N6-dimethylallyladenosine synthase
MGKLIVKSLPSLKEGRSRQRKSNIIYQDVTPSSFLINALKDKKYFFRTYGCQANVRDEETISGMLDTCYMQKVETPEEADVIIILTCCVRENAEDKVFGEIGSLKLLKEKRKDLIICVGGCMVEQPHIVNTMVETYKQVDIIFGTHNINEFLSLLEEKLKNSERIVDVKSDSGDVFELSSPSHRLDSHKAFVNIMYGCNKFCTYCIVPYVRGEERSRKKEDIIKEVECLIEQGYIEVTLLGQNVNSYGKDLYSDYTFANLLEDVAKTNIKRLRFTTSHPADFSYEMVDVIAKYDNIMKFIHLPVQSGDDEILKEMNRHYDRKKYLELINYIKEKIPDVAFSTDLIVGFPNETYEQFLNTVSLCKEVGYDNVFAFIYSPRVGTPAAKMIDNVTYEEKSKRFRELQKVNEEIIEKKSKNMIGKIYEVLVDNISKKSDEFLTGYNECNKVINFRGSVSLIGKLVKVRILESHTYSLIGELVDE